AELDRILDRPALAVLPLEEQGTWEIRRLQSFVSRLDRARGSRDGFADDVRLWKKWRDQLGRALGVADSVEAFEFFAHLASMSDEVGSALAMSPFATTHDLRGLAEWSRSGDVFGDGIRAVRLEYSRNAPRLDAIADSVRRAGGFDVAWQTYLPHRTRNSYAGAARQVVRALTQHERRPLRSPYRHDGWGRLQESHGGNTIGQRVLRHQLSRFTDVHALAVRLERSIALRVLVAAIRGFELEHGRFPETIGELVPSWIAPRQREVLPPGIRFDPLRRWVGWDLPVDRTRAKPPRVGIAPPPSVDTE
ncbi:MAG: hypothetical protein KDC38_01090, partial [Planctomycetes bacterium]|nr:hypothetical protein [Planctomycetota bacterium]